jgi:serine/threonine-protein kinase HipA
VSELLILIEGAVAGRVNAEKSGRLSFTYEKGWRESEHGYSLSVSMPLADITYPHKTVWPFLWNLLPENSDVLERWGRQYHVSAANPFKLLGFVGADVPGAAQFIPPERSIEIQSERHPTVEWMSAAELRERLRQLREDVAAVRRPSDIGKMSLPGAQAKTAYYWDRKSNRWGIPGGRTPTTHIIKPCVPGFDGIVENEHFCQDLAARLGMIAAKSVVLNLDEPYIVIERYDRLSPSRDGEFPARIHQEDACQALGLMPARKYQEDGGPGIDDIVALIRRVSTVPDDDIERFLQASMFNWLIGGTDAHAKNHSFLIASGDEVRLAPLYDLSSQLPYPDLIKPKVAMRIGAHYDIPRIDVEDWRALARDCALDEGHVITKLDEMARALPDAISATRAQARADGLSKQAVDFLAEILIVHAQERRASIRRGSSKRGPPREVGAPLRADRAKKGPPDGGPGSR